MIAVLGVIGYMSFAFAIYAWAVRTAPTEQEVLGIQSAQDFERHEAEIIDLAPYFGARQESTEELRRAA